MRFYFGQIPLVLMPNVVTRLQFANSEPQQARFHFFSPDPTEAVVLKLFKARPNSIEAYAGGVKVESMNAASSGAAPPAYPNFASPHGLTLFHPQARHVTLVLRGHAGSRAPPVDIVTLPSVQVSLTVSLSPGEFFDPLKVVNNLAALLSIDPSRIKVVSVAPASDVRRAARGLGAPAAAPAPAPAPRRLASQDVSLEILPPPNSTRLASSTDFNASTGATSGSLGTNSAVAAAELAAGMSGVAAQLSALSTTGSLGTLGGYRVAALSITAPAVPEVQGLPSPSAPPRVPTNFSATGSGSSGAGAGALSAGAVAGIVVGVVLALGGGAWAYLAAAHSGSWGGRGAKPLTSNPGDVDGGGGGGGGGGVGASFRWEKAAPGVPSSVLRKPTSAIHVRVLPKFGTAAAAAAAVSASASVEVDAEAAGGAQAAAGGGGEGGVGGEGGGGAGHHDPHPPHHHHHHRSNPNPNRLMLTENHEDEILAEGPASASALPGYLPSSRNLAGGAAGGKGTRMGQPSARFAFKPEASYRHEEN